MAIELLGFLCALGELVIGRRLHHRLRFPPCRHKYDSGPVHVRCASAAILSDNRPGRSSVAETVRVYWTLLRGGAAIERAALVQLYFPAKIPGAPSRVSSRRRVSSEPHGLFLSRP